MKKRLYMILLLVGILASGCGTPKDDAADENQVQLEISEEELTDDESEQAEFDFEKLKNLEFYFSSGAGGWRTVMQIGKDGSFSGQYSDSEMGATGEGYPNGTYHLCDFKGQFTAPVKVNEYTYSVKIDEISYLIQPETQEIKDGILYDYCTPYGLDGAEEVLIYLPGAPVELLPEEYMGWVRNHMENPAVAELPFYGLYNVTEQNGFSSYDISSRIDDTLAATEEWSITLKASMENDPLTQMELNEKASELCVLWDTLLNDLWAEIKESLSEGEFQILLEQQRAWIAEKENAVEEAGKEFEGGSLQRMVMDFKTAELTEERVYELYELLEKKE